MDGCHLKDLWFVTAREKLGVEFDIPHEFTLPDGTCAEAIARLRNFGGKNGMLFLPRSMWANGIAHRVPVDEYGCILLADDEFTDALHVKSTQDMLADWGWTGPERDAPAWMREAKARISDEADKWSEA
jgi:hypothetical protein